MGMGSVALSLLSIPKPLSDRSSPIPRLHRCFPESPSLIRRTLFSTWRCPPSLAPPLHRSARLWTSRALSGSGDPEGFSPSESDAVVLDVGGMMCDGCAASVKRILESQPQVSSATVDLGNETAFVWVNPEAKASQNWQQRLGERFANHLTNCGFTSTIRGGNTTMK